MKNGGYPPGVDYGDPFAPWNGDYPDDEWNEDPKLRERYNALADEIANAIERGAVAVELHAGQLINEWDASLTMQHDYDSNYWRLGVLLSKADGWEYTDNYNSFEITDEDEA